MLLPKTMGFTPREEDTTWRRSKTKPCCHITTGKTMLSLPRQTSPHSIKRGKEKERKQTPPRNKSLGYKCSFFSLLRTSLDPTGWRTCSSVFQALESWHWYKHCYLSSQLQKSAQSRKTKCSLIHSILIINITSLNITLSGSRYTISVLKIKA